MALQEQPSGWRKSSRTQGANNCVEVGRTDHGAAVRDTKNRAQGHFTAGRAQWQAFIEAVKIDRFA
ncbi:hypothetical protein GCM10027174_34210 [Salinifilum aidingensis]